MTDYEFIRMQDMAVRKGMKTRIVAVLAKSSGDILGYIKWHGAWRQYVYAPVPNTIYSAGCLADVQTELAEMIAAHRAK